MKDNFDKEFDDLFARDLGRVGRNALPEEAEWRHLAQRLDAAEKQWPWTAVLWWLLPLLLISNGWMWWQLNHLQTEVAAPAVTTASVQHEQPAHLKTVVYDTIYRTVVMTEYRPVVRFSAGPKITVNGADYSAEEPVFEQIKPVLNAKDASEHPTAASTTEHSGPISQSATVPFAPSATAPLEAVQKSIPQTDSVQSPLKILEDTTARPVIPVANITREKHPQPDTIANATLPLTQVNRKPTKGRVGISAGSAVPLTEHHFQHVLGLSASALFEVERGHWGLMSGLSYQTFEYQTMHGFDPRLGIDQPVSPGSQYVLRRITGKSQQLIPYLGVQYRLRPEKRLSFTLGAGYALRLLKTGGTDYAFEHVSTGVDYAYRSHSKPWMAHHSMFVQSQLELALKGRWSVFGNWTGLFDEHSLPVSAAQLGLKHRLF